jgi:hypothetical protein
VTSSPQYSLYGLTLVSDYPFQNSLSPGKGPPDLSFTCVTDPPVREDWARSEPFMKSPYRLETGECVFSLYRHEDYQVLRFTEVADFYLWPDRIICRLLDPNYGHQVEIYFLGIVMAYWLECRGVLMLHASSVVIKDKAVGFLATNRGGKSSLAVALMKSGCPLLSDDLLPVKFREEKFMAFPGYPQMRLWPNEAQRFLGRYEDLALVHPNYSKRRVPLGQDGLGSFCNSPKELVCLYLPERSESGDAAIEIKPKPRPEAVIELIRNSFTPNMVVAAGLQPNRFRVIDNLTRNVPVKRLLYPSGFEHLDRVCAAVADDVS